VTDGNRALKSASATTHVAHTRRTEQRNRVSMNEGWGATDRGATASAVGGAAPGWYADPWGQAAQRFWDGASWTPHVVAGRASSRPRLPEGTPVYWPSIWLLALLPLLGAVTVWLVHPDTSAMVEYLQATQDAAQSGGTAYVATPDPFAMMGPGYAVASLLSPVLTAVLVVLAYRDWRRLGRAGVVRPFHWAWAFLGAVVYVVGRSVVVRKVAAPRGFAPMWTAIAVCVVAQVAAAIWMVDFVASMAQQLPAAVG
jgi:hypothetical protein